MVTNRGGTNISVGDQIFQAVSEIFSLPGPNISAFLKYLVQGDRIFWGTNSIWQARTQWQQSSRSTFKAGDAQQKQSLQTVKQLLLTGNFWSIQQRNLRYRGNSTTETELSNKVKWLHCGMRWSTPTQAHQLLIGILKLHQCCWACWLVGIANIPCWVVGDMKKFSSFSILF